VKLATMAYAEVSTENADYTTARTTRVTNRLVTLRYGRTSDSVEMAYRRRASDLSLLEVQGAEAQVACTAHRKLRDSSDCDMIPVGYNLVGGRCWKAVRDGLE
jgi:hypothetical protein